MKTIEALKKIKLYAVMNSDGQLSRAKGQNGYGDTWVDDPEKARIYLRIGSARGTISFFANNYPEYPAPKLVTISIGKIEIVDECERVTKQKAAKEKARAAQDLRNKEYLVNHAKEQLRKAQATLDALGEKK